jgi:hypothetical protein
VIRSPDELARAPCFSGSRVSLITGFTCETFDLELVKLDVVDCVHDIPGVGPKVDRVVHTKVVVCDEAWDSARDSSVFV